MTVFIRRSTDGLRPGSVGPPGGRTGCFVLFDHLLGRRIDLLRSITVETINGQDAAYSPYLDVLHDRFDTIIETRAVTVYRRVAP
jgi:hypothetical protein